MAETPYTRDVELKHVTSSHLINDSVASFAWRDVQVSAKDRKTREPVSILDNVHGIVHAGEMMAIMGPSGSGKTTLLSALAQRLSAIGSMTNGEILVNSKPASWEDIKNLSSFVEQEDALVGSLTVEETMNIAARLALPRSVSKTERHQRVDDLIANFGLQLQKDTLVGTPIRKGLSGGQKKRLSTASKLLKDPRILFLDEPTSGLDSTLAFEVMNYIRTLAQEKNLIVIASIHQPSTSTFKLFDKLCLLSGGKACYVGNTNDSRDYFHRVGFDMPFEMNPAEFYLDLINTDLAVAGDAVYARREAILHAWLNSPENHNTRDEINKLAQSRESGPSTTSPPHHAQKPSQLTVLVTLLHRSWIKSHRDVVTYGIRIVMYLGLAILMGTVFLRLSPHQSNIQPFINSIFFGSAFMSFMAVAYVPAFLEDGATFAQERANGLVGPLAFIVANFLIGLPFLFIIAVLFSVVTYFLGNFRPDAHAFWMFVMWLFLDLVAAESLVVLVSSVMPIFVVALAVTSFANGLWMAVGGFLVPLGTLNAWWKYVFHYIDYQAYVFEGMMVNEFGSRNYTCDRTASGYQCMYPSDLEAEGKIEGTAVLKAFHISTGLQRTWVGIMIGIIAGYRLLGYLALWLRKS